MSASVSLLSRTIPSVVLDDSDGPGAFLAAEISYREDQPYSVTVTLGEELTWEFARTNLLDGLWADSGEGWVCVRPDKDAVLLELATALGPISLDMDRDSVESFLAASFALVPLGSESEHLDLDRCVERLLAG